MLTVIKSYQIDPGCLGSECNRIWDLISNTSIYQCNVVVTTPSNTASSTAEAEPPSLMYCNNTVTLEESTNSAEVLNRTSMLTSVLGAIVGILVLVVVVMTIGWIWTCQSMKQKAMKENRCENVHPQSRLVW